MDGKRKSHLEARASLKQKMLAADLFDCIEVTPAELSFTFSPDFHDLLEEIRAESVSVKSFGTTDYLRD
jgi:hypothetical protein